MANQTITLTDDADDGYTNTAGTVFDNTAPNYVDSNPGSGWSFPVVTQIPAGSTIDKCYMRVNTNTTGSGSMTSTLKIENADPATNTAFATTTHMPAAGTFFTGATSAGWNQVDYNNVWIFGEADSLPLNLTADMQALLDAFGTIEVGERINIRHTSPGSSLYKEIESAGGTNQPQLYIEWTPPAGSSGVPKTTKLTLLGVG